MHPKILRGKREDRRVADTLKEKEQVEGGNAAPARYESDADAPDDAHETVEGQQESRVNPFEQNDADKAANGEVELANSGISTAEISCKKYADTHQKEYIKLAVD